MYSIRYVYQEGAAIARKVPSRDTLCAQSAKERAADARGAKVAKILSHLLYQYGPLAF